MILRNLDSSVDCRGSRSAADVFIKTEKNVRPPCAIILQADHSRLAGQLAGALRTNPFGEFPAEVIEAAGQHDCGWQASDMAQLQHLGDATPQPFPRLSRVQTQPAWDECIRYARSLPPLVDVMISRHFTTLAGNDSGREAFVQSEATRRRAIEAELSYSAADLDRWTAVVGFCDLLSLYLCSGTTETVDFPLAHPASDASNGAPKVTLSWDAGRPGFSRPVLSPEATFSLVGQMYSGPGAQTSPVDFTWRFQ